MSDLWYTLLAYAVGLGLLLGYAASLFNSRRAVRALRAKARPDKPHESLPISQTATR